MRVAIVGGGPSKADVPWGDESLEVWGLGMHWTHMKRCDRVFEMHDRAIWKPYLNVDDHIHAKRLRAAGVPVVMREAHDDIPDSVAFPFAGVAEAFSDGPYGSSFDYMLAYALLSGVSALRLYGVEMQVFREFYHQQRTAGYWIGVARARGLPVWVHPNSELLSVSAPYGSVDWYEAGADDWMKARMA